MSQPTPVDPFERSVDAFVSVSHLVEEPGLARLYMYVLRNGPVTADEVVDALDASPWGTPVHLEHLEAIGVVVRDEAASPPTYTAEPVSLRLEADGEPYLITPTFVGGVARMDEDEAVRSFVADHGYGRLAVALASAVRSIRAGTSNRPRELAEAVENESLADSLYDLAAEYRDVDPYFETL